jgi:hypothetical protein
MRRIFVRLHEATTGAQPGHVTVGATPKTGEKTSGLDCHLTEIAQGPRRLDAALKNTEGRFFACPGERPKMKGLGDRFVECRSDCGQPGLAPASLRKVVSTSVHHFRSATGKYNTRISHSYSSHLEAKRK